LPLVDPQYVAPPVPSTRRARSTLAKLEEHQRGARRSEAELDWFLGRMEGCVPREGLEASEVRAAATVDGWLRAMAPHLRGALALRYARRKWPSTLLSEYGALAGLVVRLECAQHPSSGGTSTVELEAAAVARLEDEIAVCRPRRDAVAMGTRRAAVVTKREGRL
jgi:hypothetical protein